MTGGLSRTKGVTGGQCFGGFGGFGTRSSPWKPKSEMMFPTDRSTIIFRMRVQATYTTYTEAPSLIITLRSCLHAKHGRGRIEYSTINLNVDGHAGCVCLACSHLSY